jgi:hypothetical protein
MKRFLCCLLALSVVALASAQENPLAKASVGDWAKYTINRTNETIPMMSAKDQPYWRYAMVVLEDAVRINGQYFVGGNKSTDGGIIHSLKDRYEPVSGLGKSKYVKVVSTSKEQLTVAGKKYDCVKIVRKVDQPVDEATFAASWVGTSTLWVSAAVPLGLVKMENAYHTRLTKEDEGMKIKETWVLVESGFKNWPEE